MISREPFRVIEFEQHAVQEIRVVYTSKPMCLRDASRFAGALSCARGTYVQAQSTTQSETYEEWWYAGWLWKRVLVPMAPDGPCVPDPSCGGDRKLSQIQVLKEPRAAGSDYRRGSVAALQTATGLAIYRW